MYKKPHLQKGFTLIEMMISLGVFSIVAVVGAGALLKIIDASKQGETLKVAYNNLHFSLESMSREIRMGQNYGCLTGAANATPPSLLSIQAAPPTNDCSAGGYYVSFKANDWTATNRHLTAYYDNGAGQLVKEDYYKDISNIDQTITGAVTSSEMYVDKIKFYVNGSTPGDTNPSRVLMYLTAHTQIGKARLQSSFNLQTTIAERFRE